MSKKTNNYLNLFLNITLFKSLIALVPAATLFFLSYSLPFVMSFSLMAQIAIPVVAVIAAAVACHEHLLATFKNIYNGLENLWKAINSQETQEVQIFDMSFLITLSTLSSLIYALILGPAAPLVLYIAPLITIAAINLSKYLKDILNSWLTNATQEKLANFKQILPSELILADFKAGQVKTVRPNEIIAADGILLTNTAKIKDYTIRSGEEYKTTDASMGDEVAAGTRNISDHSIEIRVLRDGNESTLYKSIKSLEAGSDKTENTKLIDQVAAYFIPFVLLVSLVTLMVWGSIAGFSFGFYCMMAVYFAACPCALGLAGTLPFAVAKNMSFANNIHIHKDRIITTLPYIDTVVFDKTGTLTSLSLTGLRLTADVESRLVARNLLSKHLLEIQRLRISADDNARASDPFASATISKLSKEIEGDLQPGNLDSNYELISNQANGVSAKITDPAAPTTPSMLCIGNKQFLEQQGFLCPTIEHDDQTILVYIGMETASGKEYVGHMNFAQKTRDDAKKTIEQLVNARINVQMLTGDRQQVADNVAAELGITEFEAGCSPTRKKEVIDELIKAGRNVVVVGDGFNDIEQANAANVGSIAIGKNSIMSGFFDITIENLSDIPKLIPLAKATNNNQIQLFGYSIFYNLLTMLLAAVIFPLAGYTMMMGCFGMCMAFSSLFALGWSCLLVPKINGILEVDSTSATTADFTEGDFEASESEDQLPTKTVSKTIYGLGEAVYPSEQNEYEFSIAIQFPCSGCISKFNEQDSMAELNRLLTSLGSDISTHSRQNTIDHSSIIKFRMVTDKPGLVLEHLNSQFSSKSIVDNSPTAEIVRRIAAHVTSPISLLLGQARTHPQHRAAYLEQTSHLPVSASP